MAYLISCAFQQEVAVAKQEFMPQLFLIDCTILLANMHIFRIYLHCCRLIKILEKLGQTTEMLYKIKYSHDRKSELLHTAVNYG